MSKYLLCDWEQNGYDDSDFLCIYYDDATNTLHTHTYGTTRFAAPHTYGIVEGRTSIEVRGEDLLVPTPAVVERARRVLADRIFHLLTQAEVRLVEQPEVKDLVPGLAMRVATTVRNQAVEKIPCDKCHTTGRWVNPRNASDLRECFSCKGEGFHKGEKLKGPDGKQLWEVVAAGTEGEVTSWHSFGQFYRNGYSRPDRTNTTVRLRTSDGKVVKAGLSKLQLARPLFSVVSLHHQAEKLSYNYQFQGGCGEKCAWLTRNLAKEVMMEAQEAYVSQ
jgi:hypothetical protein